MPKRKVRGGQKRKKDFGNVYQRIKERYPELSGDVIATINHRGKYENEIKSKLLRGASHFNKPNSKQDIVRELVFTLGASPLGIVKRDVEIAVAIKKDYLRRLEDADIIKSFTTETRELPDELFKEERIQEEFVRVKVLPKKLISELRNITRKRGVKFYCKKKLCYFKFGSHSDVAIGGVESRQCRLAALLCDQTTRTIETVFDEIKLPKDNIVGDLHDHRSLSYKRNIIIWTKKEIHKKLHPYGLSRRVRIIFEGPLGRKDMVRMEFV